MYFLQFLALVLNLLNPESFVESGNVNLTIYSYLTVEDIPKKPWYTSYLKCLKCKKKNTTSRICICYVVYIMLKWNEVISKLVVLHNYNYTNIF